MASSPASLANRILVGLVVGAIAGTITLGLGKLSPGILDGARTVSTYVLDPLGQVFLRMLFFVVIPLVFASLASGVAQLGRLDRLGPLAGKTFALFGANMAIGVALGLVMMQIVNPGGQLDPATKDQLMAEFGGAAQTAVAKREAMPAMTPMTIVEMFMPRNLFGAFTGSDRNLLGDVLPLIVFAILVGAVGTTLAEERRQKLLGGLDLVCELMTGIVHFALRLAPYAVPAMIFSVIVKIGIDIVLALGV
ncbi:MAG TPA: cation:dicarboxylase symporter family transporter, partial [Opitutaceae bacterium]